MAATRDLPVPSLFTQTINSHIKPNRILVNGLVKVLVNPAVSVGPCLGRLVSVHFLRDVLLPQQPVWPIFDVVIACEKYISTMFQHVQFVEVFERRMIPRGLHGGVIEGGG